MQKIKKREKWRKKEYLIKKAKKMASFQKFYKLITKCKKYRITIVKMKWGGKVVSVFKNIVIQLRRWMKFLIILAIGLGIILFIVFSTYKPMYSVTLNGKFLGYTDNKKNLQDKISEYMKKRRWK